MSEVEWEEVKGATWADIRKGWKYDYTFLDGNDEWQIRTAVVAISNLHYLSDAHVVLLQAWKPVEKPKPTVAFVDVGGARGVIPVHLSGDHYYEIGLGLIAARDNTADLICEGIVVPEEELMEMRAACDRATFILPETRAFLTRCEELGVFGNA